MQRLPPYDSARLAEQLKRHEGLRLTAYLDSEGVLTIGYGRNCVARPVRGITRVGDHISRDQAEQLFTCDLAKAVWDVRRNFPWANDMSPARQAVLVNMTFNMGIGDARKRTGLWGFRNALDAMMRGDWPKAKSSMLKSKWAGQVGIRAIELADQMEKGTWA